MRLCDNQIYDFVHTYILLTCYISGIDNLYNQKDGSVNKYVFMSDTTYINCIEMIID